MIIPRENEKDVREIPKKVRDALTILPLESADEVLREALVLENPQDFLSKPVLRAETETAAHA